MSPRITSAVPRQGALARAIHLGEAKMARRLKQGAFTTAKNTVSNVPVDRLHPGAARYYREMGFLK